MRKIILYLIALFTFGTNVASLYAEMPQQYIVVKISGNEIVAINPDSISMQYIKDSQWVMELKGTTQKYSYALTSMPIFSSSSVNTSTGIEQIITNSTLSVCDNGESLVICNSNGSIGKYSIYTALGQLIKSGYEKSNQVSVSIPAKGVYVIKVGNSVQKTIKK